MKLMVNVIILLLALSLTGCAWISKTVFPQRKDRSYLYARSIPPLQIPPGLSSDKFHAKYPVSNKQYSPATAEVSLLPPTLYS